MDAERLVRERVENAADTGTRDRRHLEHRRVQRNRILQRVQGHEIRHQRLRRRHLECACDAEECEHQKYRPRMGQPAERETQQQARTEELHEATENEYDSAIVAIGGMARKQYQA